MITEKDLIREVGGLLPDKPFFEHGKIEGEWIVYGKKKALLVLDAGNGWYIIVREVNNKMVWSKEHFEEVAKVISKFEVCKEGLIKEFVKLFEDNPKFDEEKFKEVMSQIIATFRVLGEDEDGRKTSELNDHEIDAITPEEMNDTLKDIAEKESLELISWGIIENLNV